VHEIRELTVPRPLVDEERLLLNRLLTRDFPGRDALKDQLRSVRVAADCLTCASRELTVPSEVTRAGIARRIPVEATGSDEDGVPIHILLHVVDGVISSVEVFRDDGGEIRRMPSVDSLNVLSI
jgi:hypothetical protein